MADSVGAQIATCAGGICPVCDSPITGFVRSLQTRRTKREIQLFGCFECQSFWNPSGYVEDERILKLDLEWGLSVRERNISGGQKLFDALAAVGERPSSIIDIGCGIGTLLHVAEDRGISAVGFDVNHVATEFARSQGVDARTEFWTAETKLPKIDLIFCIMCLEHVEKPRPLIAEMCKAAIANDAALFISVPFVERDAWKFIENPDPTTPGTPFLDNDVHITHFSKSGLLKCLREFGLSRFTWVSSALWHGFVARA